MQPWSYATKQGISDKSPIREEVGIKQLKNVAVLNRAVKRRPAIREQRERKNNVGCRPPKKSSLLRSSLPGPPARRQLGGYKTYDLCLIILFKNWKTLNK